MLLDFFRVEAVQPVDDIDSHMGKLSEDAGDYGESARVIFEFLMLAHAIFRVCA